MITYNDGRVVAEIELLEFISYHDGIEWTKKVSEGSASAPKDSDPFTRFGYTFTWPACMAGTVSAKITVKGEPFEFPCTPEALFGLPDALITEWIQAVYALAPQWNPSPIEPDGETVKKVP